MFAKIMCAIILSPCPDLTDYSFLYRTVIFSNGATAGDIACQIITLALGGEIGEDDETFSLQLSPPAVGTSLVDVAGTVKIVTIEDADSELTQNIYIHNLVSYAHGAYSLITGGAVVVVGPSSVTEGNFGETVMELYIQLDEDIVILNRDVAYTIVLTA